MSRRRNNSGQFVSLKSKDYLDCKITTTPDQRWVLARISTTTVDRDGDVILPAGMASAEFMKNPVVLFGHDAGKLPIGKVQELQRRSDDIIARVLFSKRPDDHPPEVEWVPDTIHHLFKEGTLRGFSIGFTIPQGGTRPASQKDTEIFGADVRQVITQWQLVELSVVPIPANQDALAMAVSKGLMAENSWVRKRLSGDPRATEGPRLRVDRLPRMRVEWSQTQVP